MSKKEREEDKKQEDTDKDFGLPEIEITPIDQEQKNPAPDPVMPAPQDVPKPVEERPKEVEEPKENKSTVGEPVIATVPPVDKSLETKEPEKVVVTEKEKRNRAAGWIILLLFIGLLGFAFWYFSAELGFGDKASEETVAEISEPEEEIAPEPEPEPIEEEPEEPVIEEEEYTLTEINTKTENPRYLVVVGSFIDGDLAKDFSDRLNQREYSTYIITPGYGSGYYKLAIAEFDNVVDATALIENEQENFEETLWVLKY